MTVIEYLDKLVDYCLAIGLDSLPVRAGPVWYDDARASADPLKMVANGSILMFASRMIDPFRSLYDGGLTTRGMRTAVASRNGILVRLTATMTGKVLVEHSVQLGESSLRTHADVQSHIDELHRLRVLLAALADWEHELDPVSLADFLRFWKSLQFNRVVLDDGTERIERAR